MQAGIENFKFTADTVAAWRKVKEEYNLVFTLKDMLDIYYKKSNYAKYDNSSCKWNRFLKDFCSDNENVIFNNKLKAASVLWALVRDSPDPKIYYHKLVEDNFNLLETYLK